MRKRILNEMPYILLGMFIMLIVMVFLGNYDIKRSIWITTEGLTSYDRSDLNRLIAKGAVLPPEVLHDSIASYYNTIITVLVCLLGVLSLLNYFQIKVKTEEEFNRKLQELAKQRVVDLSINELTAISTSLQPYIESNVYVTSLAERLDTLEEVLEEIRPTSDVIGGK